MVDGAYDILSLLDLQEEVEERSTCTAALEH